MDVDVVDTDPENGEIIEGLLLHCGESVIETDDGVSSFSSVDEDMVWEEFLEYIEVSDTGDAFG
jgi:CheY-like chemotaxis protein